MISSVIAWFRRKREERTAALMFERQVEVRFDEAGISAAYPDGAVQIISWSEIDRVAIETNDSGPWNADVWWFLESDKNRCTYPQGATGDSEAMAEYPKRFPGFSDAAVIDVPVPGLAGSEQAGSGLWHVGFMQTPDLPEKLVPGRQDAFLGWFFDLGRFTPAERAYYVRAYGERQLHSAFEIYRAMPRTAQLNAAQTASNSVPLMIAAGENSFCNPLLPTFVEGYRAKGMTRVDSARIPGAGHYVLADNPEAVADLIEQYARSDAR